MMSSVLLEHNCFNSYLAAAKLCSGRKETNLLIRVGIADEKPQRSPCTHRHRRCDAGIFGAGKYRWLNFARSHIGSGLLMHVAAAPLPRSLELFRGVSCFRLALQGNGRTGEFHACDLPHIGLSGIMPAPIGNRIVTSAFSVQIRPRTPNAHAPRPSQLRSDENAEHRHIQVKSALAMKPALIKRIADKSYAPQRRHSSRNNQPSAP